MQRLVTVIQVCYKGTLSRISGNECESTTMLLWDLTAYLVHESALDGRLREGNEIAKTSEGLLHLI